jgi:S-ribosylhomocysteine lyase LuxS involved in autoinducer biosynthesis
MLTMDYRLVDTLNADQLEVDDLIGLGDEVVKVIAISPMRYGYALTYENEFGEKDIVDVLDDEQFDLYILE